MAWQIGLLISTRRQAIHHGERSLLRSRLFGTLPLCFDQGLSLDLPLHSLAPPPTLRSPTPSPSLLSLSVSMKKGQCERKNRRVNRGKRSRAFYTRYKYLQKCGWNTWNTHEEKERVGNIAAGRSLHTRTRDPHVTVSVQGNQQQRLF